MRHPGIVLGGVATAALAGCIVPFQTSAPPLASTVGQGHVGFSMHSEFPTVDLLATQEQVDQTEGYAAASFPVSSLQLQYGVTEDVDVEGGFEAVFFGIPLPIGVSGGVRYQPVHGDARVAIGARAGVISGSSEVTSGGSTSRFEASAKYLQVSIASQLAVTSFLRPGLTLTAAPSAVSIDDDGRADSFTAVAVGASLSLTLALGRFEIAPAINVGHLATDRIQGAGVLVSAGVYLGVRPQKPVRAPD